MLALKAFVHESVEELDDAKLQRLSETLRIDLRGCDDRRDIERVITGLVCLDQDTSLGVFLTWLRTSSESSGKAAKKDAFYNTFVPAIAPLDQQQLQHHRRLVNRIEAAPEDQVKAHHLNEEIETRLAELQRLEIDFKAAERAVHSGTPAFDKMKQFLVTLTVLRAKEEETRRFFVKQNALLTQQHREMRDETLHTRAQLDFFVDGFTNLRLRHDALLVKSTQMHAESEVAQEVFLSLSAHESHFAAVMAHTLDDQRARNEALQARVDLATETIRMLEQKQTQLMDTISQLKQARGDAKKDAHCYKRQLRNCKRKVAAMDQASTDYTYFRAQAVNLRQAFASLLGYLREAILRDTKTSKQTLSKEALRIIQQALSGPLDHTVAGSGDLLTAKSTTRGRAQDDDDVPGTRPRDTEITVMPRVRKQRTHVKGDLEEDVRGVLLLGGSSDSESAQCASILGAKFKYALIDVRETLISLEGAAVAKLTEQQSEDLVRGVTASPERLASSTQSLSNLSDEQSPLSIETYQLELQRHIQDKMQGRHATGFVLYNWEFTARDVNQLIALGFPVDSIVDLHSPVALSAATPSVPRPALVQWEKAGAPTVQTTGLHPSSRGKAVATQSPPVKPSGARAPSGSAKNVTPSPSSPTSRPSGKATPASPTARGTTRQAEAPTTPESARRTVDPTGSPAIQPSSQPGKRPAATLQRVPKVAGEKRMQMVVDRKAAFKGMLHLYRQVGQATFPEERVERILETLEQQREQRLAAPRVQWDETSARTSELLAMFAEDVHMVLVVEQEIRKPKKLGESSAAPPSSRGAAGSPTKPGGSSSRSTSPSKASPARKPTTVTARGSSKSLTKPTPAARGSGASAAATSRRVTSTATSSSPLGGRSGVGASSPDKSHRASVATSSPSARKKVAGGS